MSSKFLKSAAIVFSGAVFGFGVVQIFKPEPKNRYLASAPISKLGAEQNARSLFDVRLNLTGLAAKEDGVSEIKVTITALKEIPSGLVYVWNLPEGAQITEGPATEPLAPMHVTDTRDYVIKLKGFAKQYKKFASFQVDGEINNYSIKREILISSRVEDSLEYLIQQSELKNGGGTGLQKIDAGKKSRFDSQNVVR